MDVLLAFNFTALLVLSSFILFLIKTWIPSKSPNNKEANLPPSPPRLPIIGHLHHFIGGQMPHRILSRMAQKYGPIMHLQMGEISTMVLTSPEAAKEALKVQDPAFADRQEGMGSKIMWNKGLAFSPYGEYWRQMRKIAILELLSAKNVKSFESIRKDEVSHLIDSIRSSAGEPLNLSRTLSRFTASLICRVCVGKATRQNEALIDLIKSAVELAGFFELADMFPSSKLLNMLSWNKHKMLSLKRKVDAILDVILAEHEVKAKGEFGGEDFIDVLIRLKREGDFIFPIENENIKGIIYDMFTAGTETSATVLDWAMAELIRNPDVMTKVQKEVREAFKGKKIIEDNDLQKLTYLKLVIKETFRLHTPSALLGRLCREECKIEGYVIPVKTRIIINMWSIGRNPKYWNQPEVFLPERFNNSSVDYLGNNFELLPFGAGRRRCPGMNFGIANFMLPLSLLLYHFNWEMPKGMVQNDVDMTEENGLAVARKNPLMLVPTLYNAA